MIRGEDLTLVVTSYNIQEYIIPCLQSIMDAGGDVAPVLVVDDGSRDDTVRLVRGFAESRDNITLLVKDNGGASSARNHALENIDTKFLTFIDGDDLLTPGTIANWLQSVTENSDVTFTNRLTFWEKDGSSREEPFHLDASEVPLKKIRNLFATGACHGKIFRRDFLKEHGIVFPEGMMSEDIVFNYRVNARANYASSSSHISYAWRKRHGFNKSIMSNKWNDFAISSTVRQIEMVLDIQKLPHWAERYGAPNYHKEFAVRLRPLIAKMINTADESLSRKIYSYVHEMLLKYEDAITEYLDGAIREIHQIIVGGDFSKLRENGPALLSHFDAEREITREKRENARREKERVKREKNAENVAEQ